MLRFNASNALGVKVESSAGVVGRSDGVSKGVTLGAFVDTMIGEIDGSLDEIMIGERLGEDVSEGAIVGDDTCGNVKNDGGTDGT